MGSPIQLTLGHLQYFIDNFPQYCQVRHPNRIVLVVDGLVTRLCLLADKPPVNKPMLTQPPGRFPTPRHNYHSKPSQLHFFFFQLLGLYFGLFEVEHLGKLFFVQPACALLGYRLDCSPSSLIKKHQLKLVMAELEKGAVLNQLFCYGVGLGSSFLQLGLESVDCFLGVINLGDLLSNCPRIAFAYRRPLQIQNHELVVENPILLHDQMQISDGARPTKQEHQWLISLPLLCSLVALHSSSPPKLLVNVVGELVQIAQTFDVGTPNQLQPCGYDPVLALVGTSGLKIVVQDQASEHSQIGVPFLIYVSLLQHWI